MMTTRDTHIEQTIAELTEIFTHLRATWQAEVLSIHPDMSRTALPVLLAIVRGAPVTATELTCQLNLDKTLMSKNVAHLRSLGLVDAQVSAEDRRVTLLTCTPLATERLAVVRARIAKQYRARLSDWSDTEVSDFLTSVHRFNLAGRASPPAE